MKKLFAFAISAVLFAACGDDNSSSAPEETSSSSEETILSSADEAVSSSSNVLDTKNSSSNEDISSGNQATSSSSNETNSSNSDVDSSSSNSPISVDFGEGYTYAMAYRYDEATGIFIQGPEACNYHPDTKTFAWEQSNAALDSSKLTIVGDSMWIGPVRRYEAEDPDEQRFYDTYKNQETLALGIEHDGIYGKWKITGCKRILGQNEIKCTPYISNLSGIAQTLTITQDSIYNTTIVDLNNTTGEEGQWELSNVLYHNLGFDIGNLYIDTLVETEIIKVISASEISIGSQTFTRDGSAKFDNTGLNLYETFSSNGKTCTKHEQLGFITKDLCLEGNADFLLSARDKSDDAYYYKEGSVNGFSIDNRDEYYECTKNLVTEDTKSILAPHARQ